jgi:hypothetical protein
LYIGKRLVGIVRTGRYVAKHGLARAPITDAHGRAAHSQRIKHAKHIVRSVAASPPSVQRGVL